MQILTESAAARKFLQKIGFYKFKVRNIAIRNFP